MNPPPLKREPRADTRRIILEAGIRSVLRKGYDQSGLAEILREAGVPKGSFYYYFASKEDFGLQLIEHWLENYSEAEASLRDETLSPLARVAGSSRPAAGCSRGSARIWHRRRHAVAGDGHPQRDFSLSRREGPRRLAGQLTGCLVAAQQAGEIASDRDARTLAEFCLISWEAPSSAPAPSRAPPPWTCSSGSSSKPSS